MTNSYIEGITVVIPSYNTAGYIEECLSSVFSQSYVEQGGCLRVICVDDASTDGSINAIQAMFEYAPKINCKLVTHEINKGLAASRNTGLSLVSTQYVMFIDSDDLIEPDTLERLYQFMIGKSADVGIFEYQYFSPSGRHYPRNYSKKLFREVSYNIENIQADLAAVHALSACNKIYLTSFIGSTRFPENRHYSEDIEFWFSLVSKKPKTYFVSDAIYLYRKREDSASRSIIDERDNDASNYYSYLDILNKEYEKYSNSGSGFDSSVSWFCQKTLFYYLIRVLNLPTEPCEKSRSNYLSKCREFISCMDIDKRLPNYQKLGYSLLLSGYWKTFYLLGYANKYKSNASKLMTKIRSINFSIFQRVYLVFSLNYVKEIVPIIRYSVMARTSVNRRNTWLLGERGYDAGDNAYALFVSLKKNTSDDKEVYFVCSGVDYIEASNLYSNVVRYGSEEHFQVFQRAGVLISTHSRGNIEPFINKYLISLLSRNYRSKKYVFLGHGVTKDDMEPMLGYNNRYNARFSKLLCGSKMEFRDMVARYGYPEGAVTCAPLPRWEQSPTTDTKQVKGRACNVLIMFTWRSEFGRIVRKSSKQREKFISAYLNPIDSLLQSIALQYPCDRTDVKFHFVLHPETERTLQKYGLEFSNLHCIERHAPSRLKNLIQSSDLLITDFSSITFDFAYYFKPTIYYQFDEESFRSSHYSQGYFSYRIHGFGPICRTVESCIEAVGQLLRKPPDYFLHRRHLHFQYENTDADVLRSISTLV